jgi:hypothetical protein
MLHVSVMESLVSSCACVLLARSCELKCITSSVCRLVFNFKVPLAVLTGY